MHACDILPNLHTFEGVKLPHMRLEFRIILISLIFLLAIMLIVENDDTPRLIAQSNIVTRGVEAYACNNVLIDNTLPRPLVSKYLRMLVICTLAGNQFFHTDSSIKFNYSASINGKYIFLSLFQTFIR